MLLPRFLYGTRPEVNKHCRRAARRVARGDSLSAIPDAWFEFDDEPAYIVTQHTHSRPGVPDVHTWAFAHQLFRTIAGRDPLFDRIFDEMLSLPWMIYCCLGQDAFGLFHERPDRQRRFVTALRDHWDELNTPGRRFMRVHPEHMWFVATAAWYCLAQCGVSTDEMRRELSDPDVCAGAMPATLRSFAT